MTSCNNKEKEAILLKRERAIIAGNIVSSDAKKIVLYGGDSKIETEINAEGNFKLILLINSGKEYIFNHGKEYIKLYLAPLDSLVIKYDATDLEETLELSGIGFEESKYLQKKQIILDNYFEEIESLFELDFHTYNKRIEKFELDFLNEIDLYNSKNKLNSQFVKNEALKAKYLLAINKLEYAEANKIKSDEYFEFLNSLNIENESLLKMPEYKGFIELFVNYKVLKSNHYKNKNAVSFINDKFKLIPIVIENQQIQDFAIYQAMIDYIYHNKGNIDKKVVTSFFTICKVPEYVNRIKKDLKEAKLVLKNNDIAPNFSLENKYGKLISLKDFLGKYVLLDFWATWCGPCVKEIPVLEQWREKINSNKINLEIISISIDKNEELWRNTLSKKEMKGIHLIAKNGYKSKVCQDYGVGSLPRFILINPKGKIENIKTPNPSSQEGRRMFEYLKK